LDEEDKKNMTTLTIDHFKKYFEEEVLKNNEFLDLLLKHCEPNMLYKIAVLAAKLHSRISISIETAERFLSCVRPDMSTKTMQ
jgi:hypothetical protein